MRGITNGAVVRAFNDRGAFAAVAMVTDDVMPGVVVAPLGLLAQTQCGLRPQCRLSMRVSMPTLGAPRPSPTTWSR